jgi:hypothetical protein
LLKVSINSDDFVILEVQNGCSNRGLHGPVGASVAESYASDGPAINVLWLLSRNSQSISARGSKDCLKISESCDLFHRTSPVRHHLA